MGGRGSRSQSGKAYQVTQATIQPTAQAATAANNAAFPARVPGGYKPMYNGRQYFLNQNLTIDQQLATMQYLDNNRENGSLYSASQNLNYAMAHGQKLTANQAWMKKHLMGAMHNLGKNTVLTRYDHDGLINSLLGSAGLNNGYENYTASQLKNALVGTKFGQEKFLSTSYNNFKNAPPSTKSTFDSRAVKIVYNAKASAQAFMPGNGPGGALGEIILAPSGGKQNMKITDVRLTGKKKRRQGTQSYTMPEVELVVEVE